MSGKRVSRRRGRPPTVLIDDPAEERERGEYLALMAQKRYEREILKPGQWKSSPPMQPTCDLDRGLVYARHAGLVAWQSVKSLLKETRAFCDWIAGQRGARGPAPDKDKAVKLFLAIRMVRAVRSKMGLPKALATPREVAQVLELLDGEAQKPDTVKHRMDRLRPMIEGFEVARKAAKTEAKAAAAGA